MRHETEQNQPHAPKHTENSGVASTDELQNKITNYYSLSDREQVEIINLLQQDDPMALENWYNIFEVIHCEDNEPFQEEEEQDTLHMLSSQIESDPQLSLDEQREIKHAIVSISDWGEIGVPVGLLNMPAADLADFLNDNFLKPNNSKFILKVVHIPVRLINGDITSWQVAKLIPTVPPQRGRT